MFNLSLSFRSIEGKRFLALLKLEDNRNYSYTQRRVIQRFWPQEETPAAVLELLKDKKKCSRLANALKFVAPEQRAQMILDTALHPEHKPPKSTAPARCHKAHLLRYGHLAFKGIWEDDLKLRALIEQLQQNTTKITTWSLNALLFYFVDCKMRYPNVEIDAHTQRYHYFYCPWDNIRDAHFAYGLEFLHQHGPELIIHAAAAHRELHHSTLRTAFVAELYNHEGILLALLAFDSTGYPLGCQTVEGAEDEARDALKHSLKQRLGITTVKFSDLTDLPEKVFLNANFARQIGNSFILPDISTPAQYHAHFYLAMLSFMLILEVHTKLTFSGVELPFPEIPPSLDGVSLSLLGGNSYDSVDLVSISLHEPESERSDQIFKALGLQPAQLHNSLEELKQRFKLQDVPNSELFSKHCWNHHLSSSK